MTEVEARWEALIRFVNGRQGHVGAPGIRDPEHPCELFDGLGYNGRGDCHSDGHWLCTDCSLLSPEAPRFIEYGREGRIDRLRLFWGRQRATSATSS